MIINEITTNLMDAFNAIEFLSPQVFIPHLILLGLLCVLIHILVRLHMSKNGVIGGIITLIILNIFMILNNLYRIQTEWNVYPMFWDIFFMTIYFSIIIVILEIRGKKS